MIHYFSKKCHLKHLTGFWICPYFKICWATYIILQQNHQKLIHFLERKLLMASVDDIEKVTAQYTIKGNLLHPHFLFTIYLRFWWFYFLCALLWLYMTQPSGNKEIKMTLLQHCWNFKDAITILQQCYSKYVYPLTCLYSKYASDEKSVSKWSLLWNDLDLQTTCTNACFEISFI